MAISLHQAGDEAPDTTGLPSRDSSIALLHEYTKSASLRVHARTVEAAMRWYAQQNGCDQREIELWGQTGLLHDFDYERFPVAEEGHKGHPYVGVEILQSRGYPQSMLTAILGHVKRSGVTRDTPLAKTLFAVDELCGLAVAAVLIRPVKTFADMPVKSLKKRFKDKAFARGCCRDDIREGAESLGVTLDDHFTNVLEALKSFEAGPPPFELVAELAAE